MPMVYSVSLATAGNLTTSATPNTETEAFFVKPGTRNVTLAAAAIQGKGSALSTLSSIIMRVITWATASTVGTGITPAPKDPGSQAAKSTAASRPTSGATRKNHHVFGCGATGQGGFQARDPDSMVALEGSAAGSISLLDASGTASLVYEASLDIQE